MANTFLSYTEYKRVDLNFTKQIPIDWTLKRGKFFFKEISKRSKKGEEQLLSVSEHKGIVPRDSINVTMFQALSYEGYKLCNKGDIVINSLWAWHRGLGVSEHHGIVSTAYGVYRPLKPEQWNHRYLNYLLRDKTYVGECLIRSKGIWESRYLLSGSSFLEIPFLQPPLEVQNSIVTYLDKKNSEIEKFIRNKERLVELLEEHKNGIINQTIIKGSDNNTQTKHTEFDWLGKIPLNWKVKKLRFLGSFQNGVSEGADYFGSGFPFVSYGDVYNNTVLPTQIDNLAKSSKADRIRFSVKEGDVFFTRTSETIEEIGFSSTCYKTIENGNFSGFLIRFRPKQNLLFKGYSKYYFRSNLHRRYFVKEMNLVTRASLSQDLLKNLPVILPSLIEQKEIAKYLDIKMSEINLAISKAQKEISSIKEYREALITDLVTGRRSVPQLQLN